MRIAAVTGGSGTVGTATVQELIGSGWQVRALARSDTAAAAFPTSVDVVRGHLGDPSSVAQLVAGSEVVFHIAGINTMCVSDKPAMWAINVEAPLAIYRAAAMASVRRMVHISSAAAVGKRTSFYAETKWAADERLTAAATTGDVELALIAPSSVQGPGRTTGTGKLILDIVNGRVKVMIDTAISVVDIADCALAIRLAADAVIGPERLVVSGFTVTTREALDLLEQTTQRQLSVRFIPAAAVRSLAYLGPLLGPIGRRIGVELCPEMIRTMAVDHIHDGSAAARQLGMSYRTAAQTFERLIGWAKAREVR